MDSVMRERAVTTLAKYANYSEKQLIAIGEIQPCIDSILSRLKSTNGRGSFANAIQIIAVIACSVWLSYRSAVRSDFTLLICFSPFILLQVWRLSFRSNSYWNWKSITEIEAVSELWRSCVPPMQATDHQNMNTSKNNASNCA
jgi:hypothetical protein